MPPLFDPLRLGDLTLPNRILLPPPPFMDAALAAAAENLVAAS